MLSQGLWAVCVSLHPVRLTEGPRDCSSLISLDVLWEEGKAALEQLLKFMVHPAISSINLTTALGSLANIARQRPMFMSEVIQAYETLHGRLGAPHCPGLLADS